MNASLPQPSAAECRALRKSLGLTVAQMAELAGLAHRQRWVEYESERAPELPDRYRWTLLMLSLDLHPTMRLARRHDRLLIDWAHLAQEVAQKAEKTEKERQEA